MTGVRVRSIPSRKVEGPKVESHSFPKFSKLTGDSCHVLNVIIHYTGVVYIIVYIKVEPVEERAVSVGRYRYG